MIPDWIQQLYLYSMRHDLTVSIFATANPPAIRFTVWYDEGEGDDYIIENIWIVFDRENQCWNWSPY